jgi:hypothetical protein
MRGSLPPEQAISEILDFLSVYGRFPEARGHVGLPSSGRRGTEREWRRQKSKSQRLRRTLQRPSSRSSSPR